MDKLDRIKRVVDDGLIKIVLMGSFSEGKTSAIAGLLRRLEDSMVIDRDESSDEIEVYRPDGLKREFEIVDTPGLFGKKEKNVNGQMVRFSDITKNYISEAHIVVYLCDAVVPLKDSHAEVIKKVLRDLNKLDSTIFVINKMDETDVDLLDEDDYARGSEIKKQNLIGRLRSCINLTPDEERKLKIVCISADPKSKGMKYWLEKWQEYRKRSRIDSFRKAIDEVVEGTDVLEIRKMTSDNSIEDMLENICKGIDAECTPVKDAACNSEKIVKSMENDAEHLKKDLIINQQDAQKRLGEMHKRLISEIDGMSLKTVGSFIEQEIGVRQNKESKKSEITFWKLERNIDQIFNECGTNNQSMFSLMDKKVDFEGKFNESVKILDDSIKKGLEKGCVEGAKKLGNVNVNNKMVLEARNVWFKNYKFKPYGAKHLASDLNTWAGRASKVLEKAPAAIAVILEAYSWYSNYKNQSDLIDIKNKLKDVVNDVFADYNDLMKDENYFKNLAPSYVELTKKISEQKNELNCLNEKIRELEKYKACYEKWIEENVQDAEIVV